MQFLHLTRINLDFISGMLHFLTEFHINFDEEPFLSQIKSERFVFLTQTIILRN